MFCIRTQFNGFNPQQFKPNKSLNFGNPKIRWFYQPFPKKKHISFSKKQYLRRIFHFLFPVGICQKPAVSAWAPVVCLPLGDPGIIRNLHIPYSESTPPPSAIQHLPSHWWQPNKMLEKSLEKRGRIRMILKKHLGESVAVAASVTSQTFKLKSLKKPLLPKVSLEKWDPSKMFVEKCTGSCSTNGSYLVCQVAGLSPALGLMTLTCSSCILHSHLSHIRLKSKELTTMRDRTPGKQVSAGQVSKRNH